MPRPRNKTSRQQSTQDRSDSLVRINKYIAEAGICSRRKADEFIEEGRVKVNGKTVYEMGRKIDPSKDTVTVGGRPVQAQAKKLYFLFNKPKNVVTSTSDPEGRPTVLDFFKKKVKARIFPVGRLDFDTEGLLLMTNDGEFSNEVIHPKTGIPKTYLAKLDGKLTPAKIEKLKNGVTIVGGRVAAKHVEIVKRGNSDKYDWAKIIITEGKNRQVRRMFEKVGLDVKKLKRTAIGGLHLGRVRAGEWETLSARDLLKIFTKPNK